ncbi:ribulose 1,5-bisphosphate carboxylase [Ectothiorhodospiraceae bacterium WFHF3C12]|nr:ribulose 1,5-bisphosphate carboxylase [Ectothiorhodospiraceae bacterium WFHF3C12]
MTEQLSITYHLHCQPGESVEEKARDIGLEQTIELPHELAVRSGWLGYAGRVEDLEHLYGESYRAVLSYPGDAIGAELTQLLNLLFGNISLKDGIEITAIDWPESLLAALGGPGQGIAGIRDACRVPDRALLCTALKPMGLDAEALAGLSRAFALGGVDIIKDDHGLTNQPAAPFRERLPACQRAVEHANRETGRNTLYFPNVTAGRETLRERLDLAAEAGCRGVLVCPMLIGLEGMSWIRDQYGLAVMAHPSLTGSYFRPEHGLRPELLLGEIFRIAGADASIYPNVGGRFGFTASTCQAINDRLRGPLGELSPALPTVGGGVNVADIGHWLDRYGSDTIFLIGGSLYAQPDLTAAAASLIRELERCHG